MTDKEFVNLEAVDWDKREIGSDGPVWVCNQCSPGCRVRGEKPTACYMPMPEPKWKKTEV